MTLEIPPLRSSGKFRVSLPLKIFETTTTLASRVTEKTETLDGKRSLKFCVHWAARRVRGTGNGWRGVSSSEKEIDGTMLLGKLYGRAARFQRSRDIARCIRIALTLCFALK
jgi:hypothetical protein